MNKIVGIFYREQAFVPEFSDDEDRLSATRDIVYELEQLGCDVVLLAGEHTLQGDGRTFSKHWVFDTSFGLIERGAIAVDVIFARAKLAAPVSVPLVNHPDMVMLMRNKLHTYTAFPDLHPATYGAANHAELFASIDTIATDTVVIKPVDGSFSENVIVCTKQTIPVDIPYPVIVQEFIDTSVGIIGITPDEHDLRVVVIDGQPSFAMVRVPEPGSHVAGIRKGASTYFPAISDLPDSVLQLVTTIDASLTQYGSRVYAIDCGMSADGPKVIELNSNPAIWPSKEHVLIEYHNQRLAQLFASLM